MTAQIPTNMPPNDPTGREASSPGSDDPYGLVDDWDTVNRPPAQPEPDASPVEPPRFPGLLRIAQVFVYLANRSWIVAQVINDLDPRKRSRLNSACQALQHSQYTLVVTCISVGLMMRNFSDDPDIERRLRTDEAAMAFRRGFAAMFHGLPSDARVPRPE
ncbi:hypothetical protein [Sorangium cellulosum]|uniref:Uncharacterized protein n=1 Tax=Sorangium cellulosum So0157-2 TaxID=1254432 RepID=S4Y4X2_SORCE|nr:hypothetical protein [Sorangium cellulosum]AGP39481.1 hypothetical protein SCE1572_36340 [Sorangium cellulosum So0157-2]